MNFKETLNKGVPIDSYGVLLRQKDLLEIVTDKKMFDSLIDNEFNKFLRYLESLGENCSAPFFKTMEIKTDKETLQRYITFSPIGFYGSLYYNLNVDDNVKKVSCGENHFIDPDGGKVDIIVKEKSLQRIDVLKSVRDINTLEKEFPSLYKEFHNQMISLYEKYKVFYTINKKNYLSEVEKKQNMNRKQRRILNKKYQDSINEKMLSFDDFLKEKGDKYLIEFIGQYAKFFGNLVTNIKKITDFINSKEINIDMLSDSDKEKIELYIAYKHLEIVKQLSSNCLEKQEYLYYVSSFFSEHKSKNDSNLSIRVGSNKNIPVSDVYPSTYNGKIITVSSLYDDYKKVLIDNPNLRVIDFTYLDFNGMMLGEVQEFMQEYLKDLSANWQFLEPGDKSYEDTVFRKIRKTVKGRTEEEIKNHRLKLLELFMEKKNLYDSSDPFFRIKGKNTFDGYIGFIYPNGRVILDKFYDGADNKSLADGHAVYAMNMQEFYELSKLSKNELIKNKLCKRYIHKGNWAKRVLENEILPSSDEKPNVDVKELIKKGVVNQ